MASDHNNSNKDADARQNGDAKEVPFHHDQDNPPPKDTHAGEVISERDVKAYWRDNVRLLSALLCIWFVVSFGFGILLMEPLNQITLFGFKLGFWWAQQGSIFVFVGLIFAYSHYANKIERRRGVSDR